MMQSPFKQLRLHLYCLFVPVPMTKYSLCTGGNLNICYLIHFIIYKLLNNVKNVENSSLKLSHKNGKKWPVVLQGRNEMVIVFLTHLI